MRSLATALLAFSLFGCSEQVHETYATYAEAERAGTIDRGWIPSVVPSSARDIEDSHDIDTSIQTLRFTIPPLDVGSMVAGLRTISAEDSGAAANLIEHHGFGAASKVYVVCAKPRNGALAVDTKTGRAVFETTVDWLDDDCR